MNTIKILNLSLALTLIALATSCSSSKEENVQTKQEVLVKTAIVKQESISLDINFTATLVPFNEVHLAPATPGRIEKITIDISDNVKKGQVLVLMDRSNLEQSRINLMNLETNFKRLDTLKKTNSIADQQYDQVKSAYKIAKTGYQFLLDNTRLKAPFNGVISGKYYENGEIYSGAPNPLIGKAAVISIVQINELKALLGISANYYPLLKKGMKVAVSSEIYPDMAFKGEIFRIYPTIDESTKTFTVEVKIQNTGLKLRPGMFSKIQLDLGKGNALMVPTIALIKQTGTNDMYVFTNKNNIAVKKAIKTGRIIDDKTEILSGINTGDEIIVVGQNKLEDQMPITIVK